MKALKIAIVNELCTAGAARCARDLEEYLMLRQHTVRYYPRHPEHTETVGPLLADLSEFSPDVVHLHSFYGNLPYSFLADVSHLYPTCFTPHDPRPIGTMLTACWDCTHAKSCFHCPLLPLKRQLNPFSNPYFRSRLRKRYTHWRASKQLALIAVSQWMKERLMSTEMKRFHCDYIPHGIKLHHFRPIVDARQRLQLPQDKRLLLHIAHPVGDEWYLNERKGLKYLAEAFIKHILPKFPETFLLVVGEKLVPNHPNVIPLGTVSHQDIPLYYSAADIFVAPTLADSFNYTVLEAMACQTAVVGSRIGGVPGLIEDGKTGYLVPPADTPALAKAVMSILNEAEKIPRMGAAGRLRAETFFTMERVMQQHEEVYEALIASYQP